MQMRSEASENLGGAIRGNLDGTKNTDLNEESNPHQPTAPGRLL